MLYVKAYCGSDPNAWWGLTESQILALRSSGLNWFVVLLLAESGYMLNSGQVEQGLLKWSLKQGKYGEYYVHEKEIKDEAFQFSSSIGLFEEII